MNLRITLALIAIIMLFAFGYSAGYMDTEPVRPRGVIVDTYPEWCEGIFDTYSTNNYDAVIEGAGIVATTINSQLVGNEVIVLETCTDVLPRDEVQRITDVTDHGPVTIRIIENSYYEPDGPEWCEYVLPHVRDILVQHGLNLGPSSSCLSNKSWLPVIFD